GPPVGGEELLGPCRCSCGIELRSCAGEHRTGVDGLRAGAGRLLGVVDGVALAGDEGAAVEDEPGDGEDDDGAEHHPERRCALVAPTAHVLPASGHGRPRYWSTTDTLRDSTVRVPE